MNRRRHKPTAPQRGATAFAVILTVSILAILSHNIVNQGLFDYNQGAQTRDAIALQQLTDSALAQALYFLNRNDAKLAAAPIRESFGVAAIDVIEDKNGRAIRIAAHVPESERPRRSSRVLIRLARDAQGRWSITSVADEPIL